MDAIENSYKQKLKLFLGLNDKIYLLNAHIITIISYFYGYQYVNSWFQKEIYPNRTNLLLLIERLIDKIIEEEIDKTKRITYYINYYVRSVIYFSFLEHAIKTTFTTFNNNNEKETITLFLEILNSNDFSISTTLHKE
ncbi:hypothetical protein [Commensalibacter communis]|nr:hypothetical protein [Commensalibacter communis]